MAVWLSAPAEAQIHRHAVEGFPQEVCGLLVGRYEGADVRIERVRSAPNAAAADRSHRFVLHPRDVLLTEDELAGSGLEIVGFYHSHPGVPAAPSPADQEHAWPGYVYAIVSVLEGQARHVACWRASSFGGRLREETVVRG